MFPDFKSWSLMICNYQDCNYLDMMKKKCYREYIHKHSIIID